MAVLEKYNIPVIKVDFPVKKAGSITNGTDTIIAVDYSKIKDSKEEKRIIAEEKAHYEIWKKYTGIEMKPQKGKVFRYKLLARFFGFTFAVKLMENGEGNAQEEYAQLLKDVPESIHIREQEEEHEHSLLGMLDEERLQYVGSMVLGMNDALGELTGSLAGFTVLPEAIPPMTIFVLAPGGFFVFGILIALANKIAERNGKPKAELKGCSACPMASTCTLIGTNDACKEEAK
mgnify:CR=1 FL=1